jgi:alkylhydroperoxidase family enzyme
MLKLGYFFTRKQFGSVPGPLGVFCARMPFAFTGFYGKLARLDKKLTIPAETAVLIREQVARTNVCAFCMDANRWAAINKAGVDEAKLDALEDYDSSPLFSDAERTALEYATEVTREKEVRADTFADLRRHFDERQVCEIVWLVASEHLYNINNIALGIESEGYCSVPARSNVGV